MKALIDAAVQRWRTVILLLLFILVAGFASYRSVPKEAAPDINIPLIYTSVTLEGISPEDAERLLIRPLEKQLQAVENVKEMTAQAVEGMASVTLEFQAGFNADLALQDVRNAVDEAKPDLPAEADEPVVVEVNFSKFPILNVLLTGDVQERVLVRIARDLRDDLESLSTVLEAKLAGEREEMLEVLIDPVALEGYSLSPAQVFTRVENNNILVPAGEMDTGKGRFSLKLPGLIEAAEDLRNVPLKVDEGVVTTLSDVADVRRSFKDVLTYARVNGRPAIGLSVSKRTGANIIETVEAVKALVEREQRYWPPGIEVIYSNDQSKEIADRLNDLQNNIILAVMLVAGVIWWVMGMRTALLVGLAIPGAFLFGVMAIGLLGFTFNIVVLFALILSIGMLVDSAIVVCEYADRLMMDGKKPVEAYPQAAVRMAWPVIASTVTTLVVFMPLLFWPGIVGEFMRYMPMTLILTLSGSLLMALIFMPVLGAHFSNPDAKPEADQARRVLAAETGNLNDLHPFTRRYVTWLNKALDAPKRMMGIIVAVVFGLMLSYGLFGNGVEFFPDIEPQNVKVEVRARGNLSVEERFAKVQEVLDRMEGVDGIETVFTTAGKISLRQETPEDAIGEINLELKDWSDREPADVILAEVRRRTRDIPGIMVETTKEENGPPVGKAVQLQLSSRNYQALNEASAAIVAQMEALGGFINMTDERPVPQIEWELRVNRELAGQADVSVADIGQMVKFVTNGIIVNTYRPDDADDELDIIVRFPPQYRTLSQLDRLRVQTAAGQVPLSNFVQRVPQQKVSTIRRADGERTMTIRADLQPGLNVDAKLTALKEAMVEQQLISPEVSVSYKGEDEEQKAAGQFLATAFLLAIFIMMLLLVTQFNSMYDMAAIMSAVFFSTGGVFLGLLVTGTSFGVVMCGVGIISLAGIVVNNNIIFIDTYKLLRAEGMEKTEALLRTGAQRLRPILLTAGTTVLGLLPMVFKLNIDFVGLNITYNAPSSQWWVQMSTAIAGGLTFATVLTLFFTPCFLMVEDGVKARIRKVLRKE
jgi:multidrug efflux pump